MNVLIDLDGTLTDPAVGMVASFEHALRKLKLVLSAGEDLKKYIGPPIQDTFRKLLATEDEERIANAVQLYRERYATIGLFENTVYPGVGAALEGLQDNGANLYVATSKPEIFAERILQHFGLAGHFRAIYGSDLDGSRSNKAELIAHILKSESISAAGACMVGDRSYDVVGARANGVRAIGVLWGYGSREELLSAGATALCEKPAMLRSVVGA